MGAKKGKSFRWEPEIIPRRSLEELEVQSQSHPEIFYIVNLKDYDANGSCTCDHFTINIEPSRKAGLEPIKKECKHITRCFSYVGREIMRRLSESDKNGKKKKLDI